MQSASGGNPLWQRCIAIKKYLTMHLHNLLTIKATLSKVLSPGETPAGRRCIAYSKAFPVAWHRLLEVLSAISQKPVATLRQQFMAIAQATPNSF
ncbi:hypothetical protein [Moorena bouillonii]|uniref:Uncharacterized protein n=1 Tax=Moorena bouillonii PNG TaxID=568701 RepID=A0A1U7MYT8_9CYAN|nr:hypothetical protein [Moorena bouillonii]OLT58885.1 hypothetical protein BJP37_07350 [Moorena bouillonii PNG]